MTPSNDRPDKAILARAIDLLDEAGESRIAKLRGHKVADLVMYAATAAGEHGFIWHFFSLLRWARGDKRSAIRASVALVLQSLVVDWLLKSLVRRDRPKLSLSHPLPLRSPRSSSFPSGHASAGAFMAIVLGENDPWRPFYLAIAAVISSSRIFVGVHHTSDVIAGALAGTLLGMSVKRLFRFRCASRIQMNR